MRRLALGAALATLAACSGDTAPTQPPLPDGMDPARVAWLADHAHPLASVSPQHTDWLARFGT